MGVVITGTSSGIGLATTIAFARAGHEVHATLRDPGKAGPLTEAAERAGVEIEIGRLDVTDAVSLAQYLLRRGPEPAAPFPNPGVDPDGGAPLGCERGLPAD